MSTEINIKKKLAILNEGANITTDASSIDFVGSGVNTSSVGNNVTVTIPGNSGNTTYYLNYSVPVGSYSEFSSIPTSATEQVVPWITNVGETDVAFQFETQVGVPNTTQIPAGLWQFFLHFNALSSNQYWTITPEVYKVDISSVETLLFTSDPIIVSNMPLTTTMYVSDGVFPATTLLATDRLIVKILLQNTGFNSQSLNFVTEGSQHYSVVFTTLNQVVPTGAVTSVTGTAPIVSSGGTTPAISIPQATGSVNGYLSSSDWSVFSAKLGGSGTTNYLSKFSTSSTVTNSQIFDNGTNVGIGTITPAKLLDVNGDILVNGLTIGRGNSNINTNTVVGNGAGTTNTTGTANTAFGYDSMRLNTTGSFNAAFGLNSLKLNTTGQENTALGRNALESNTTGSVNTSNGVNALASNTTGNSNTALGSNSLRSNTTGSSNTALGIEAGRYIADGITANTITTNSVFLGANTKALADNQSNQIVIGHNTIGKGSNTVNIGNSSITNTYLNGAVTINNAFTLPSTDGTANYFLKTNGSGTVSWGVAGLSFFSEAQATTGVNATVYANSLTAVSTTTNADFAIIPKGTGAILAQIPDGTATGGNKRGANSLDLQTARTVSTNVASGQYSVVLGYDNKANALGSIGIGYQSYATGTRSIALGNNAFSTGLGSCAIGGDGGTISSTGSGSFSAGGTNTTASNTGAAALCSGSASGANSFAMGFSSASGTNSVAMGGQFGGVNGSSATGNGSFSMGLGCVADAGNSSVFGVYTSSKGVAQRLSIGSLDVTAPFIKGNSQLSLSSTATTTTTNTAIELTAYNGTAINLVLQDNEAIRVKGSIIGKQTASTNVACYDFDCVIVRGVGVATTSIVGTPSISLVVSTIVLDVLPTLTANTTLGGLSIKSGAKTTTTIKWSCRIDSTEVILA